MRRPNLDRLRLKSRQGFETSVSKPSTPSYSTYSLSPTFSDKSVLSPSTMSDSYALSSTYTAGSSYQNGESDYFGSLPTPSSDKSSTSPFPYLKGSFDDRFSSTHSLTRQPSPRSPLTPLKGNTRASPEIRYVSDFTPPSSPFEDMQASVHSLPLSGCSIGPVRTNHSSSLSNSSNSLLQTESSLRPNSSFVNSPFFPLPSSDDLFLNDRVINLFLFYEKFSYLFTHLLSAIKSRDALSIPSLVLSLQEELFNLCQQTGTFYLLQHNLLQNFEFENPIKLHFDKIIPYFSRLTVLTFSNRAFIFPDHTFPRLQQSAEDFLYHLQFFFTLCANNSLYLSRFCYYPSFVPNTPFGGKWTNNGLSAVSSAYRTRLLEPCLPELDKCVWFLLKNCDEFIENFSDFADEEYVFEICSTITSHSEQIFNKLESWDMSIYFDKDLSECEQATNFAVQSYFVTKQRCYDLLTDLVCSSQDLMMEHSNDFSTMPTMIASIAVAFQTLFENVCDFLKVRAALVDEMQELATKEFENKFSNANTVKDDEPARQTNKGTTRISRSSDFTAVSEMSKDTLTLGRNSLQSILMLDNLLTNKVVQSDNNVKGGTLPALVHYLVQNVHLNKDFRHSFLLTYKTFTTPQELFTLLVILFHELPPPGLDATAYSSWEKGDNFVTKKNVCTVMNLWVQKYFFEDLKARNTLYLISEMRTFLRDHVVPSFHIGSVILSEIDNLWTEEPPDSLTQRLLSSPMATFISLNVYAYTPEEFASQMTLLEFDYLKQIPSREWIFRSWVSRDSRSAVRNYINFSNCFTYWIINCILEKKNTKARAAVISFFIQTAYKCLSLQNFSTLMSIVSALNSAPIYRLHAAYKLVKAEDIICLSGLREIVETKKNFSTYRALLRKAELPCVPFLGVILSDLTFIDEGNPDVLDSSPHLLNFNKRHRLADVVADVCRFQSSSYDMQSNTDLQSYILHRCRFVNQDLSYLFDKSLSLEPRSS
ncbi:Ras guanine nucleotide exchange factor efc25 [Schizosaccharomyces pombe]